MMKRYIIGFSIVISLIILMAFSVPVKAINYCTVGNELIVTTDFTSCVTEGVDTTCKVYFQNETTKCPYGCDNVTMTCSPAPFQVNLIMLFIALMIMTLMGILIKRR